MSLPHHARMVGKQAFSQVFKQPVVSSDAAFRVLARPNGRPHFRLGMAVSRKVDGRAVARNRIKRLIRESFRAHYGPGSPGPAADIVVLPRREAVAISNPQLFLQLEEHWARIDRRLRDLADRPDPPSSQEK